MRSHNVLYIPYGGKEIAHSNYVVLVSDIPDKLKWLPDANGKYNHYENFPMQYTEIFFTCKN